MDILGINAFHGDSSAVLLRDGRFQFGIEEERLRRIKHWAGFPAQAICAALRATGSALTDVGHVAISRDPAAHLLDRVLHTMRRRPGLKVLRSRLQNHQRVRNLSELLGAAAGTQFRGQIHNVEHHHAHMASAFYCSPFDEAACLTVDGFGDFLSSMSAVGRGTRMTVQDHVMFPHSLGILYTALTQFLGFPKYGDEYKVMGLAAFGEPRYLPEMRRLIRLLDDGCFELDVDFFQHASEGVTMSWDDGEPNIGPLYSRRICELLGAPRGPDEQLEDRHRDVAASLQAAYEEAFFHRVNWLQRKTGQRALCLAGGCVMNSVANGKLFERTDFRDVFIQSAAGDAGTALGAALYAWHAVLGRPREFVMEHSYFGSEFDDVAIRAALVERFKGAPAQGDSWEGDGIRVCRAPNEAELVAETARALAAGEIVGWFQGRSEWGPRALGNRSILADPRRADMRDVLNARIKKREAFRPFAPSILEERVGEYFEQSYPDPFMIKVYPIRPGKRAVIPAVTHVDGTGRLQTVSEPQNPRYFRLLKAFEKETGIPLLLNTSFNENEPIVERPQEALDCFVRTRMDRLVLGDFVVERRA